MKALVYAGPRRAEVRDVSDPAAVPGAVRVGMRYCGLCGSDIGIFAGLHPRAKAPLIFGHEFAGVVEAVPEGCDFAVGERVVAYPLLTCGACYACRNGSPHVCASLRLIGIDTDGGMAGHAWIDPAALIRLPDALSDEVASLVEPLAVAVRSLHQARFAALDRCVVIGAGPIGLLTAIALRHAGASRVLITDIQAGRLALCRELGFDALHSTEDDVAARVMGATGGDGADIVFECTGAEAAALSMSALVRIGGMICMTGIHKAPHPVNLLDIGFKELRMVGTRVYTRREFEDAVTLAQALAPVLARTITHRVPLSGADAVFDLAASPTENAMKIIVDCRA